MHLYKYCFSFGHIFAVTVYTLQVLHENLPLLCFDTRLNAPDLRVGMDPIAKLRCGSSHTFFNSYLCS